MYCRPIAGGRERLLAGDEALPGEKAAHGEAGRVTWMVRTVGDDAAEQKVIDDIGKYGWHCVNVLAEGDEGPFSFTVGLFQTLKYPELLIYGLPSKTAHEILTIAVDAAKEGHPLNITASTDELLNGFECCFVEVPNSAYRDHVGFARWYYQGDDFPLYQIVWPSRHGHFPWHVAATSEFRAVQPVLGHPLKGD